MCQKYKPITFYIIPRPDVKINPFVLPLYLEIFNKRSQQTRQKVEFCTTLESFSCFFPHLLSKAIALSYGLPLIWNNVCVKLLAAFILQRIDATVGGHEGKRYWKSILCLGNDQWFTSKGLQPAYSDGWDGLPGWTVTWAKSILYGKKMHAVFQSCAPMEQCNTVLMETLARAPWKHKAVLGQGCTLSSKPCLSSR